MKKLLLSFVLLASAVFVFSSCVDSSDITKIIPNPIIGGEYSIEIEPSSGEYAANTFIEFKVNIYKNGEPIDATEVFSFSPFKEDGMGKSTLHEEDTLLQESDGDISIELKQNTVYKYKVESGEIGQLFGFTIEYNGTHTGALYQIK